MSTRIIPYRLVRSNEVQPLRQLEPQGVNSLAGDEPFTAYFSSYPLTRYEKLEVTYLGLLYLSLAFIRMGNPESDAKQAVIDRLDPLYPAKAAALNRELSQLLIYLEAPGVVQKTLLDQILQESVPDDGVSNTGLHRFGQCGSFVLSLAQEFLLEPLGFKENIKRR